MLVSVYLKNSPRKHARIYWSSSKACPPLFDQLLKVAPSIFEPLVTPKACRFHVQVHSYAPVPCVRWMPRSLHDIFYYVHQLLMSNAGLVVIVSGTNVCYKETLRNYISLVYAVVCGNLNIQHILCCVFVLFVFVLCTLCCQFLGIVQFWSPIAILWRLFPVIGHSCHLLIYRMHFVFVMIR